MLEYASVSFDLNTIGLWRLEDGRGPRATNAEPTEVHGILGDIEEGDPREPRWTKDAKVGNYALSFDGVDDFVEFPAWIPKRQNGLEQTPPTVISDDAQTSFWTATGVGVGNISAPALSDDGRVVQKGTNSLKMVVGSGLYQAWDLYHEYKSPQDWSERETIDLWWYGANTGANIRIIIVSGIDKESVLDASRLWRFTDSFTGWGHLVFALNNPLESGTGSFNLNRIWRIELDSEISPNIRGTWYLDRVVVDIGQRIGEEIYVPDSSKFNFGNNDDFSIELWFKTTERNEMRILSKRNDVIAPYSGYLLWMVNGKVVFFLQDSARKTVTITTTKSYNDGGWHHVAASRNTDKKMVSIAMDGVEVVNATDPTTNVMSSETLKIGTTIGKYNYIGLIDEISISRRSRPFGLYEPGGIYLSRIFDASEFVLWKSISWTPLLIEDRTAVTIRTRVSNDSVSWSAWSAPYINPLGDNIVHKNSRYLQIQAALTTSSRKETPILRDIAVRYESIGSDPKVYLRLEPPHAIVEGQNVILTAFVSNERGEPKNGSRIDFFVNNLKVGSALSDLSGKSSIQYKSSRDKWGKQVLPVESVHGAVKSEGALYVSRAIPETLFKTTSQTPFIIVMSLFIIGTILYLYTCKPRQKISHPQIAEEDPVVRRVQIRVEDGENLG